MEFTKMHGAGNDFIIINNIKAKIPVEKLGRLAESLCQRRFSIGADGFMVVDAPDYGGDYKMRFYNADGTFGEMCGNGARCVARYGYESGLAGETQKIETIAGMVMGYREDEDTYRVRLNDISVMKNMKAEVCGQTLDCVYIELGDPGIPHVVVKIPGLAHEDKENLRELGEALRYYKDFVKGVNVNFYDFTEEDGAVALTYERGVEDFTLACGTGTSAVVATLKEKGLVDGTKAEVQVPGGKLFVEIADEGIFLSGPTVVVAEGYVNVKELLD